MKELQKEKWIGIALGIVGIAASIFILYMSFPKLSDYIEKYLNYEPAKAVVIEEYNDGQLLIEYVVNNKPYQEEISDGRTRIPRTVNIKYNPQNPSDIISSFDTTIIIIIAFIFFSALLGTYFFLKSIGIEKTENVQYINCIKVIPMKLWQQMLLCVLFFLIGLGLLAYATDGFETLNLKTLNYKSATATVVGYEENKAGLKTEIFEYTVDSQTVKTLGKYYTSQPKKKNTRVKIRYNPKNLEEITIIERETDYFLLGIGLLFSGVGIYGFIGTPIQKLKKRMP